MVIKGIDTNITSSPPSLNQEAGSILSKVVFITALSFAGQINIVFISKSIAY